MTTQLHKLPTLHQKRESLNQSSIEGHQISHNPYSDIASISLKRARRSHSRRLDPLRHLPQIIHHQDVAVHQHSFLSSHNTDSVISRTSQDTSASSISGSFVSSHFQRVKPVIKIVTRKIVSELAVSDNTENIGNNCGIVRAIQESLNKHRRQQSTLINKRVSSSPTKNSKRIKVLQPIPENAAFQSKGLFIRLGSCLDSDQQSQHDSETDTPQESFSSPKSNIIVTDEKLDTPKAAKPSRTLEQVVTQDVLTPIPAKQNDQAKRITKAALRFHGVSEQNRARIFDWMIQVFRVLGVSSPSTYFTACHIIDSYYAAKYDQLNEQSGSELLYLIGITAIFISSKYQDVVAISLQTLIDKAGHNKFSKEKILRTEREILKTLGFRIHSSHTIYEESLLKLRAQISQQGGVTVPKQAEAEYFLLFLSYLSTFSVNLASANIQTLSSVIAIMASKSLKSSEGDGSKIHSSVKASLQVGTVKSLKEYLKSFYYNSIKNFERDGSMRNLEKDFPQFLSNNVRLPLTQKAQPSKVTLI